MKYEAKENVSPVIDRMAVLSMSTFLPFICTAGWAQVYENWNRVVVCSSHLSEAHEHVHLGGTQFFRHKVFVQTTFRHISLPQMYGRVWTSFVGILRAGRQQGSHRKSGR